MGRGQKNRHNFRMIFVIGKFLGERERARVRRRKKGRKLKATAKFVAFGVR